LSLVHSPDTQVTERPKEHPEYEIRRGLFRHILHSNDFKETPFEEQWKECVSRDQRSLDALPPARRPDRRTSGHRQNARWAARLYYWPSMFSDVTRYVHFCQNCLAHKSSQMQPAGLLHASAVKAPWEQVTVDLVGPLPRSTNGPDS